MMAGFTKRLDNDDVVDADDTPCIAERRMRYCLELSINSAAEGVTQTPLEVAERTLVYNRLLVEAAGATPATVH
jgi:hypothetical protein